MARDDPELVQWFKVEDCKENVAPPTTYVAKQQGQSSIVHDEGSQDSLADEVSCEGQSAVACVCVCQLCLILCPIPIPSDGQTKGGRWDKSLGILCQKFIMLFLVAPVSGCSNQSQSRKIQNVLELKLPPLHSSLPALVILFFLPLPPSPPRVMS